MRRHPLVLVTWLALALSLWQGMPVSAAAPVAVEGTVRNGTAGGSVSAGLVVTVVQLGSGDTEVARRSARTDEAGRFRVEGLVGEAGSRFLISADHARVRYSTMAYSTRAGNPESASSITAELEVFETTDDEAVVAVTSDSLTVIKGREDVLEVLQILGIRNTSDRTFVGRQAGDAQAVLQLPVPPGAFDLAPRGGLGPGPVSRAPGGIATSDPVLPGERFVSYLYKVRAPRSGWVLSRAVAYPTTRANILAGPGLEVGASGFNFRESVTLGGRRYRRYRGGPLSPGGLLEANVQLDAESPPGLWWGLAVGLSLVLVGGIVGAGVVRGRRRMRLGGTTERGRLVEEIAALDEAFAAGSLAEPEYRRRRKKLKSRLVAPTEDRRGPAPPSRPARRGPVNLGGPGDAAGSASAPDV